MTEPPRSSVVLGALAAEEKAEVLDHLAGCTRYGYPEPTEAGWQLLEEALEPWLGRSPGAPRSACQRPRSTLPSESSPNYTASTVAPMTSACSRGRPDFASEASDRVHRALTQAGIDGDHDRLERALAWR